MGEEAYEEVRTFTADVPGDNLPHVLLPPVKQRTEVVITCGFGAANLQIAMRENSEDAWIGLPGVGTYTIKLKIGEMLHARSDLAARVPMFLSEALS